MLRTEHGDITKGLKRGMNVTGQHFALEGNSRTLLLLVIAIVVVFVVAVLVSSSTVPSRTLPLLFPCC
jgi:hypothetical protein